MKTKLIRLQIIPLRQFESNILHFTLPEPISGQKFRSRTTEQNQFLLYMLCNTPFDFHTYFRLTTLRWTTFEQFPFFWNCERANFSPATAQTIQIFNIVVRCLQICYRGSWPYAYSFHPKYNFSYGHRRSCVTLYRLGAVVKLAPIAVRGPEARVLCQTGSQSTTILYAVWLDGSLRLKRGCLTLIPVYFVIDHRSPEAKDGFYHGL